MVSDSELIDRLRDFLRNADLDTTSTSTVRRQLESDFGIDLSDRKSFIREQINLYIQTEHQNDEADEEEEEDEEEEDAAEKDTEEGDEEDDDNEEEEEEKPKRVKKKGRSNKVDNEEVVKKKGGGFCKLCSLSPQLQEFVGAPEMARTEVVKQLWVYIKEKDLQDPNNRRNIICDEPLRGLFGVNSINMFQMNKALTKHIWPLDSDDVIQVKSAPKEKQKKQEREDDPDEPERKKKRQKGGKSDPDEPEKPQKGGKSGFLAPLQLSDALVNFFGTGESELSRSEVVKKMWEYIKGNNLQDPSDKRKILCDEKLKELFGVDTFVGFTVIKLLAPHFKKIDQ